MNLAFGLVRSVGRRDLTAPFSLDVACLAASRNSDRTLPLTASRNFSLLTALHNSA